jgi:hypothetical protein
MGNPRNWLANALYDPWKADVIWGTQISEKLSAQRATNKRIRFRESQARFDSGNIGIC